MSEPKLLSREELEAGLADVENICLRGDLATEIRAHIAALEKERDGYGVAAREWERLRNETYRDFRDASMERDEAVRIGKQFQADSRKHFDQSCTNLQRAEHAEKERDDLRAEVEQFKAKLERYSNPRCQREECARERASVDALEQQVKQARKERDEALADNAALVAGMKGVRNELDEMVGIRAGDKLRSIIAQPHPGAALLEEHRKALGEAQKALESQQAECHTLRRAFLHERHRADTAGAPPEHAYNAQWAENLLAEERKALARARNEGREEAAQYMEGWWGSDAPGAASSIRAMKEPEK